MDTLINKGFSGGPLLTNEGTVHSPKLCVIGIVVGYKYDVPLKVQEIQADKSVVEMQYMQVRPNSGYAIAVGAKRITTLLNEHF